MRRNFLWVIVPLLISCRLPSVQETETQGLHEVYAASQDCFLEDYERRHGSLMLMNIRPGVVDQDHRLGGQRLRIRFSDGPRADLHFVEGVSSNWPLDYARQSLKACADR